MSIAPNESSIFDGLVRDKSIELFETDDIHSDNNNEEDDEQDEEENE